MLVKCNKCGHVGDESEFPKDRDFCQVSFIAKCPKCDNRQSPGDASMRMFGGTRPFEFVRPGPASDAPIDRVLHSASDAS